MIAGSLGCGDSGVVSTVIQGPSGSASRIACIWAASRDLIGAPHPQRHRGENLLEPVAADGGGEQPKGAPFAWLQRRAPQAQQVSLSRELTRAGGLAGAGVLDRFFRRSVRNVGGHADEVFHGQAALGG
jgi:hypothetical protein